MAACHGFQAARRTISTRSAKRSWWFCPHGLYFCPSLCRILLGRAIAYGVADFPVDRKIADRWPRTRPTLMREMQVRHGRVAITMDQTPKVSHDFDLLEFLVFDDLSDPRTVRKIRAADLGAETKDGSKVRRISIVAVDDAITYVIAKRLPWLDRLASYRKFPDNQFTSVLPPAIDGLVSGVRR